GQEIKRLELVAHEASLLSAATGPASQGSSRPRCTCNPATGVTFTNQTGLTLDLAAGATAGFTLTGAAAMSNASDNTCQGAVFTIPVVVLF
ncbi:MAG TPA: hypothetical protein VE444_10930, partial [Gaiellaceae bacterium]|nr:hypothetical protein [Gaiellaceae bacterium]